MGYEDHPAFIAACRFIGISPNRQLIYGGVDEDRDPSSDDHRTKVRAHLHRPFRHNSGGRGWAQVLLMLAPDWRTQVFDRRLHELPAIPDVKPVFVLHVDEQDIGQGMHLSPAIWTPGGKKVQRGWLAWQADTWTGEIQVWATGTTASRASKKLLANKKAVDAARAIEDVVRRQDRAIDAAAMEGLAL